MPLSEGQNTITAVVTDIAGNTAATSITVNAVTTGNYIRLTANPESGISPLETTLKIDSTFSIETSSISYKGLGGVEWLSSSVDEYRIRLFAEGIHTFTANVIGPDGNTIYQDTVAIVVQNRDYLDNLLKGKWEGMKNALIAGDVEGALNYFTNDSKGKYRKAFVLLQDKILTIASNMQSIELIYVKESIAKYRIQREQVLNGQPQIIAYYIYFSKNGKGIWQIEQF